MKANTFFYSGVITLLMAINVRADIIAGPINNPANGHDYYLLTPNTWSASEAEAEALGGTLAVVRNADEQKWIYARFGSSDGRHRNLWIGLHRKEPGGDFFWVDGAPLDYTNWYGGEPNNLGGNETCVEMFGETSAPGTWNDTLESCLFSGVVEVSKPVPISQKQRALIGDWYRSGKADRVCHIAETRDALFTINEANTAGRIIFDKKGFLYVVQRQIHGEVIQDKILWSNGTWWSREPMDYEAFKSPAPKTNL